MKKLLLASLMLTTVGAYAQTKNVIIEDYTGLHCGWCPEGTVVLEGLKTANPTKCIPIAIHTSSYEPASSPINMQSTVGQTLTSTLKVLGYPNGSVNRKRYAAAGKTKDTIAMGRNLWAGAYAAEASATAIASVSISNRVDKTGGAYECDVNVVFTALPPAGVPCVVQLFVIQDSIAATGALAQDNYSSAIQGGASPLNPWWHNRTLRLSASGDAWGFSGVIPATPVIGTKYTKHVTFSAGSDWVTKHMNLVAYVALNGSAVNDQKEILNSSEISLNSFFKTGVQNVTKPVEMLNTYPNPASVNDIVKVEYNINETSNVTMKVMNALGQVVAVPYNSFEVAGAHTIRWKASEYNMTAGMYIIQISTKEGTAVRKINIY